MASDTPQETTTPDTQSRRPWLGVRGKIATGLAGAAGGMATNYLSGTGIRGLAGVAALAGVVSAAFWLRGLDRRAWLPRYASWLFLMPAGLAAVAGAFTQGSVAGWLAAAAAVLVFGAVLSARSIAGFSVLLLGAALIGVGVAGVTGCSMAGSHTAICQVNNGSMPNGSVTVLISNDGNSWSQQ